MINPLILSRFLKALPETLSVAKEDREAIKRCGVALNLDLLHELSETWEGMLKAKSWEEFLELRGAYKGLQTCIELPEQISLLRDGVKAKNEAAFAVVEQQLKGLANGSTE